MPQCCFCFLQTSGECETDPTGELLYRNLGREKLSRLSMTLGREKLSWLSMEKEHWAKSGRQSCSGNPPQSQGESRLEWDVARFTYAARCMVLHRPNASDAYSGKVFSWSERQWDFWLSKDWKNRVPRLLFAKQTKTYNLLFTSWKTQFAILMKFLHSAELNASAAKIAL